MEAAPGRATVPAPASPPPTSPAAATPLVPWALASAEAKLPDAAVEDAGAGADAAAGWNAPDSDAIWLWIWAIRATASE
jgi:hypothetical protein